MNKGIRCVISAALAITIILAVPITPRAAANRLFNFDKSEITKIRLINSDRALMEDIEDPEKIADMIDALNNFEYTASHPRDPDLIGYSYAIDLYSDSFDEDGMVRYEFGPDCILADGVWYISEEELLQPLVESIQPGGEYWVYVGGIEWTLGLAQKIFLVILYGE